jgi:hypothetical protein
VPRKVHINTASPEEKDNFKKKTTEQIFVDRQQQQQQKEEWFIRRYYGKSIFFYDCLVRMGVWIDENKRPLVRVTGSHQHSCIFGAVSIEGNQVFG